MKLFKTFLLIFGVLLVLADVSWRIWSWHHYADYRAFVRQFTVGVMHTNDMSGVGIYDAKTGQPIWSKFDFGNDSNSIMESYYFQGKAAFDVALSSNRAPRYDVIFRGPGKSETVWLDHQGKSTFTERIFYDTNGDRSEYDVWYAGAWHPVDRRGEHNGIIIDGQWHQLAFDTNHNWTIEAVSTNHF